MNLTPEQKARIFQLRGLDPNAYDLTDDGSFIPKDVNTPVKTVQPSATPDNTTSLLTKPNQTSALGAAGRSALSSFAPTMAGFGAAALASEATPIAHAFPPYSEVVAPLIAGLAASYGANKLQEPLLSDSFKQQLQQGQQEHPIASTVGGFIPSFGVMNPITSLKNIPTLASGATKLLTKVPQVGRSALTDAEQAVLQSSAINTGVGAGQNIYSQMQGNEPFNYGDLALNAGLSGLLTEPTAIGRKLFGFQGIPPSRYPITKGGQGAVESPDNYKGMNLPDRLPSTLTSPLGIKELYDTALMRSPENSTGVPLKNEVEQKVDTGHDVLLTKPNLSPQEVELELAKARAESATSEQDYHKALAERKAQEAESQRIEAERIRRENETKIASLQNTQQQEVVPEARGQEVKVPAPKQYSEQSNVQQDLLENVAKEKLRAKGISEDIINQAFPKKQNVEQQPISVKQPNVPKTTVPVSKTDETAALLSDIKDPAVRAQLLAHYQQIASKRGQTMTVKPAEEVRHNVTGKEVAGYHNIADRENVISETKAGPGTPIHEIGHGVINDLRGSTAERDVNLVDKGLSIFKTEANPEESLAIAIERQGLKRAATDLYGTKREKFGKWWEDVKSHLAVKYGINNDGDLINHLLARIESDAPYGSRSELLANKQSSLGGQSRTYSNPREDKLSQGEKEPTSDKVVLKDSGVGSNLYSEKSNIDKNYGPEIEQKLGEASFKAAREAEKLNKDQRETLNLQGRNIGLSSHPNEAQTEALDKASNKAAELEAFTRPDVQRHSENPQINTEEFKKWFGNSKVVDKEGKPTMLYHGTYGEPDFTKFDTDKRGYTYGRGSYLTAEKSRASEYATGKARMFSPEESPEGARVYPVYAKLENPFITSSDAGVSDIGNKLYKTNRAEYNRLDKTFQDKYGYKEAGPVEVGNQWLRENGYDGIIKQWRPNEHLEVVAFHPEQIKSAIGNKGTFDSTNPDIRYGDKSNVDKSEIEHLFSNQSTLPKEEIPNNLKEALPTHPDKFLALLGGAIDKVDNIGTPSAKYAADALRKHALLRSFYKGEYKNKPQNVISQFSNQERANVDKYAREMDATGKSDVVLSPVEQQLMDSLREHLKKVADENEVRKIKKDPNYWPNILSLDVANEWTHNPSSPKAKDYEQQWLAHADEHSDNSHEDNVKILRDYQDAIGNRKTSSIEFGALRKAEGIGLPITMQDNNLLSRISRYGERVAKDMAYYETLQKDPVMRYIMRIPDAQGNVESVAPKIPGYDNSYADTLYRTTQLQNVQSFIHNDFNEVHQPVLRSISRTVSSGILGTATGVRNIAQIPVMVSPYVTSLKDVPLFFKSLGNFSKAWKESFESNSRQQNLNDLEFGSAANPNVWANRFNQLADALRKYSGRNLLENTERAYEHGLGEAFALANIGRAKAGDTKAIDWLQKFGTIVEGGVEQYYKGDKNLTPTQDVLNRISKSFVDRVSGTYDERGLPAGAMQGSLAPFMSLSRWNLEKSNVIYKDVVRPALENKSYAPLLTYTLGSILTGAAIKELNELLSNKKAQEPSLQEASSMENKKEQTRAVINLLQLSSYGGIVSDIMKAGADLTSGKVPQGLAFPLEDFVGGTIGKNVADMTTALEQGEDKFKVATAFIENVLRHSVQTVRLAANYTWNRQEVERQNKFRDMHVFNELSGEPQSSTMQAQGNPFLDMDTKKFKRTEDIGEAVGMLPSLINDALDKAKGDPYKLRKELGKIKENSYQTMPSPSEYPTAFLSYLSYLEKTQGKEAAQSRLLDYMQQNALNRAKSGMVP